MELIEMLIEFVKQRAADFGARPMTEANKSYVFRRNVDGDALLDGGGYFGFILPEEELSGPYHDFSFTVNPTLDGKPWHVNICIGSSGFRNDYDVATRPGLRRLFAKLVDSDGYCKSDFSDTETTLPKALTQKPEYEHFRNTFRTYSKLYTAIQLIRDPGSDEGKKVISAFLAAYAKLREWPTNNGHRAAITAALEPFGNEILIDDESEVKALLQERKFVVLQGPPGTGKTRLAKSVVEGIGAKSFFTQFHAETSYSDFIYGIRPGINNADLNYVANLGEFTKALDYANKNEKKDTVLIIDEINRANLSNVLGPIFYLFEHKMDLSNVEIEITPELRVTKLPDNFFVIATMNTADRSLAVVDFALRRRFAWYTVKPQPLTIPHFYKKDFQAIQKIFEWNASSEELSLQPGQGYFIANSDDEITNRIRFEIYPLIKEYLQEGLLTSAREDFNEYFSNRIGKSLYE